METFKFYPLRVYSSLWTGAQVHQPEAGDALQQDLPGQRSRGYSLTF